MSGATLWIDEDGCTVVVKNGSAIHILPLWVFESIRDIIVIEAEKKVEVTHRDFDIQQELLDRYRADNRKLRELLQNLYAEWRFAHARMRYIVLQHEERMRGIEQCMRELGITGVD